MNENGKVFWPGWETVRLIGRGSFGAVYEIQRDILGDIEKAALKVISIPQNASDIEDLYSEGYDHESITATFNAHLKNIVSEYSLMRKLDGSANIVNCKDVRYIQHDDGIGWDVFIRMELLTPLMKALPVVASEDAVIKLGKDICNALVLCKKYGIVHRDIKPQNIFVSPNGDYKLGDFGIAKTVEKTMGGTKIGTYKYMAPEVYNNQPYGSAADIYSLGLVLYWLLNERRMPFMPLPPARLTAGQDEEARSRRLSGEELPAPAHGNAALKQIVLKACAYDPGDRYASAEEMLEELNKLNGATPVVPPVAAMDPADPCEDDATTGLVFGSSQDTGTIGSADDDATVGPVFGGSQDTDTADPADEDVTVGPVFGGTQTAGDPVSVDDDATVGLSPTFAPQKPVASDHSSVAIVSSPAKMPQGDSGFPSQPRPAVPQPPVRPKDPNSKKEAAWAVLLGDSSHPSQPVTQPRPVAAQPPVRPKDPNPKKEAAWAVLLGESSRPSQPVTPTRSDPPRPPMPSQPQATVPQPPAGPETISAAGKSPIPLAGQLSQLCNENDEMESRYRQWELQAQRQKEQSVGKKKS